MNMITIMDSETSLKKVIAKRHRRMKTVKIALECAAAGFVFGLTPYMFQLADAARGYDGLGGEVMFPLLAVAAYGAIEFICDGITAKQDVKDTGLWK